MPKDHQHHDDDKEQETMRQEQQLHLLRAKEVLRLGTEMAQELQNARKAHDAKPALATSFLICGVAGVWLTFGTKIAGYTLLLISAVSLLMFWINAFKEYAAVYRATRKSEEL